MGGSQSAVPYVKEQYTEIINGKKVSTWIVKKRLGHGAFGSVSLVQDEKGKEFALKDIKVNNKIHLEKILSEIEILRSLHHENIVNFYKSFKIFSDGKVSSVCIVMEYCEGTNLREVYNCKAATLPQIVLFFLKLCSTVHYLHSQGLCHRDIKPENIVISENEEHQVNLKLLDFGIAKRTDNGAYLQTMVGHVTGTAVYLAPEILNNGNCTTKVDVWALGVILYEGITGDTDVAKYGMVQLLQKDPNRLQRIPYRSLRGILKLMLEDSPDKRISSENLIKLPCLIGWKSALNMLCPLRKIISSDQYFISSFVDSLDSSIPTSIIKANIEFLSMHINEVKQRFYFTQNSPLILHLFNLLKDGVDFSDSIDKPKLMKMIQLLTDSFDQTAANVELDQVLKAQQANAFPIIKFLTKIAIFKDSSLPIARMMYACDLIPFFLKVNSFSSSDTEITLKYYVDFSNEP